MTALAFLASAALGQDSKFAEIFSKTQSQKSYAFKIAGGADSISGNYEKLRAGEKGTLYVAAAGFELVGQDGFSRGRKDKDWTGLIDLVEANRDNASLGRLVKLYAPHLMLQKIVEDTSGIAGDSDKGYTGNLQPSLVGNLVHEPWIAKTDLLKAKTIKGDVRFTITEGLISKVEIHITGGQVPPPAGKLNIYVPGGVLFDMQTAPPDKKKNPNNQQTPKNPLPPNPNPSLPMHWNHWQRWVHTHPYYYYNPNGTQNTPINATIVIELKEFGSSHIPEGAIKTGVIKTSQGGKPPSDLTEIKPAGTR